MNDLASPMLSVWQSFYVIVGSSGAALIGIQFIVITLIATMRLRPTPESLSAFATPTVVHFGGALLVSAVMNVPWRSHFPASVALAVCGLSGLAYGGIVIYRAHRQTFYQPVWEDWLWYAILPSLVYATLVLGAVSLSTSSQFAEFLIGTAALGLLFIGIHNAWDSVTHIVVETDSNATTSSACSEL